jgi:hypothetical protein
VMSAVTRPILPTTSYDMSGTPPTAPKNELSW